MMTAEALTEALAELERLGWPLYFVEASTYRVPEEDFYLLTFPDGGEMNLEVENPLNSINTALLTGFLVAQLEARGLRREVAWSYRPGLTRNSPQVWRCRVTTINRYGNYLFGEWLETEFAALIECCLALPALPDAQQTQEVADDRQ